MQNTLLKTKVMRRVKFIYWTKRLYHSYTLKVFLLGISGASATLYVSLPHVIQNMPSIADVASLWRFFSVAFLHTSMPVQLITLFAVGVIVWLAADLARAVRESRTLGTQNV